MMNIQMMNICSQIESEGNLVPRVIPWERGWSEGILLFSYLYVLFYLVVDGCLNVQTVI